MKLPYFRLLAAIFMAAPLQAQDYPIRFARQHLQGVDYKITQSITQAQDVEFTQAGNVLKQEKTNFSIDFQGVERVIDLNRDQCTRSVIVEKLTKGENGAVKDLLAPGSIVAVVSRHGDASFAQNGQAVSADLARILRLILPAGVGGDQDDRAYGTKERKKVGDEWPLDGSADELKIAGLTGNGLQGTVRLKDVEHAPGGDILLVEVHSESKAAFPPGNNFVPDSGGVKSSQVVKLPVDPNAVTPWCQMVMEASMTAHKDGAPGGRITFSMTRNVLNTQTMAVAGR